MKFLVIFVYQNASKVHRELKMRVQTKAQPLWSVQDEKLLYTEYTGVPKKVANKYSDYFKQHLGLHHWPPWTAERGLSPSHLQIFECRF